MICKTIEIRDSMTLIPAIAIKLEPGCEADRLLLARSGYGTTNESQGRYVALWPLEGLNRGRISTDPFDWPQNPRTIFCAHLWLQEHFDEIESGHVVCVEYLLGERSSPKVSEFVP